MSDDKSGRVGGGGGEIRRLIADISLGHSAIAEELSELARDLDNAPEHKQRSRIPEIAHQLRELGDQGHETARNLTQLFQEDELDTPEGRITTEIAKVPSATVISPSTEAPAAPTTKAFWMNLAAFLVGVGCQVLTILFPPLQEALAPVAVILLSGANIGKVLNGSLWKHGTVFVLGIACQVCAVAIPSARSALFSAAGLLLSAADLPTILARLRGPEDTSKGTP